MVQLTDATGAVWTRAGKDCTCADGRALRIVPEMTDEYVLSVINASYACDLPESFDLTAAMKRLRDVRALILNALAGVQGDAVIDGDMELATAAREARQGLKDMPKLPALLAASNDDEFNAIAKQRYAELVAAAPLAVKLAFRDLT